MTDIQGEVLFEFRVLGNAVRVAAIHAPTNTEVVVVCPVSYTEFSMRQAALRKLRRALERRAAGDPAPYRGA
jgi:hypothetical protein